MAATQVPERQLTGDARLGLTTAVGCAMAYVLFVALPLWAGGVAVPTAVEGPWAVGVALSMYVAPVAAALAAWASVSALLTRGQALPPWTRRLHLVTVALVAGHLVLCVATLRAAQLWLD